MAHRPKQDRLTPWLVNNLNSQRIPGLEWIDKAQHTFKIAWKHSGKKEWTDDDGAVFREWAIHTGNYRLGQDEPDYAVWKTRIRCALHKAKDIKEIVEHRKDAKNGEYPHRVYQFVPRPVRQENSFATTLNLPQNQHIRMQEISVIPNSDGILVYPAYNSPEHNEDEDELSNSLEKVKLTGNIIQNAYSSTVETVEVDGNYDMGRDPGAGALGADIASPDSGISSPACTTFYLMPDESSDVKHDHQYGSSKRIPEQKNLNMSVQPLPVGISLRQEEKYQPVNLSLENKASSEQSSGSSFDFELEGRQMHITVNYRDQVVEDMWTTNINGCCLYYGKPPTSSETNTNSNSLNSGPEPIHFPPLESKTNDRVTVMTSQLLSNLEKGLILECKDGDIYATRLCRSSIFYSSYALRKKESIKLERRNRTKIFDFKKDFQSADIQAGFPDNNAGVVQIGFGQRWNWGKSESGVCISVKVESTMAANLQAVSGSTS